MTRFRTTVQALERDGSGDGVRGWVGRGRPGGLGHQRVFALPVSMALREGRRLAGNAPPTFPSSLLSNRCRGDKPMLLHDLGRCLGAWIAVSGLPCLSSSPRRG